jgi:hypothetical protein
LAKSSYGWSPFWLHNKINPPPKKKTTEVSDFQMVGRKGWKENITTNRQFCRLYNDTYVWRPVPGKPGFWAVRFPPVPVEQIVHNFFVSGLPAARGLPRGMRKDSLASPPTTPVKSSRCRVRSDNKITCPDS